MSWRTATLGELCDKFDGFVQTGPFGSQLKQSEYVEDPNGVPVVMPKDIKSGRIDFDTVARITEHKAQTLSRHFLADGDIIFPRRGDINKLAIVENSESVFCGTGCLRIHTPSEAIVPKFLFYFLSQPKVAEWLEARAIGSTMLNLNTAIMRGVEIRFPDRPAQQRIASTLAAYDDLIENSRRRIGLLEEAARQLYKEWFVRFRFPGHAQIEIVDGSPVGWAPVSFSEMADVVRGRSYTSEELRDEGGRAFVNLKCINRFGGFRDSGVKGIEGAFKEKHTVSPGDIVMAVTDMTRDAMIVAQSGRISKTIAVDAVFSMDLVKIVAKPHVQRDWLYSLLRFSRLPLDVREHASGTNVLHLKPKHIEEWRGFLPPEHLRDCFVEAVQPIFDQIDNLQLQSRSAARARDLLLPKLMSGAISS